MSTGRGQALTVGLFAQGFPDDEGPARPPLPDASTFALNTLSCLKSCRLHRLKHTFTCSEHRASPPVSRHACGTSAWAAEAHAPRAQDAMKDKAARALYDYNNQYPPYAGVPELRQAVARHAERQTGIPVDAATETLVTVGASEALSCAFLGLINRGDEVILFDPQASSHLRLASERSLRPCCRFVTACGVCSATGSHAEAVA